VPWVKGAAIVIRREAFDAVGGFDESFFMYFEDTDLCYRLNAAGWTVHFAPVTTVVHTGNASTAQYRADMNVQLLASTMRFYQRHSSTIRLAETVMIVKSLMLVRWMVGTLSLYFTRDVPKRCVIAEDIAASQRVLLGHWQREADRPLAPNTRATQHLQQ
jgi:GT2 family glycosyltransferase